MKNLSRILSLAIGSAAVLASISPAQALTWTLNNVEFVDNATASGTFDYDATTNTYSNILITLSNTTGPDLAAAGLYTSSDTVTSANNYLDVFNSSSNSYFRLTFTQPLTNSGGTVNIVNTPTLSLAAGSTYYGTANFSNSFGGAGTSATVSSTTAVPFDIPYGATIPAFGSVLALGAMRKVRTFKKA